MVTGFENTTYELTPFELEKLIPLLVDTWDRKGLDEIITMKQMIDGMNKYLITKNILTAKRKVAKVNGPRMRKLIQYIRTNNLVQSLIANSKGYFKSNDEEAIDAFIKSNFQRANAFKTTAFKMLEFKQVNSLAS